MTIRMPRITWASVAEGLRDIASIVRSMLNDEAKPARWDDVWMLGNAIASAGNPKAPTFDFTEYAYRFTNSATGIFAGCIQNPHKMRIDGPDPIVGVPHLHIYSRTAASTTSSAKHVWRLRWRWYDAVGVQPDTWNEMTKTFTATGVAGQMMIASFGEVTASYTLGVSSLFKFEIAKLVPGGDRLYYVDQADTHVQFDQDRGSLREAAKWDR